MLKDTAETLCETRANETGNRGKHVENCYLRGFLRHLVPSFHAPSYIDGTTQEYQRISNVFSIHFSL